MYIACTGAVVLQGKCYATEFRATAWCIHSCGWMTVQGELGSKDDTVKELRRWLDQAQGQLQNTQTALHEREADCKTLSADLKAALADLKALKVDVSMPACLVRTSARPFSYICSAMCPADAYAEACQLVEKTCIEALILGRSIVSSTLIILAQLDQFLINMAQWRCECLKCHRTHHMQACRSESLPSLILLHLRPCRRR